MRNRIEEEAYKTIAGNCALDVESVRTIVASFFSVISSEAKALPFNNDRKIFTRKKFDEYVSVINIPFIGRIGPSYTRYLKWRFNASKDIEQKNRNEYSSRISLEEIERAAKMILAGEKVELKKKKRTDLYKRVWLVSENGKRQARQVIPK